MIYLYDLLIQSKLLKINFDAMFESKKKMSKSYVDAKFTKL